MNAMAIWLLAVLMSSSFVVIAYQVPGTSNSSLQVHRDGTLTFDVLFLNWTGFWVFPKVIPAGLYFTDEDNGLWSANNDLIITISPLDEAHVDRRVLQLSPKRVYVNQYEALNEKPGDCEDSPTTACCSNNDMVMQFDLYQNATKYVVYGVEVDADARQFELSINAALANASSGKSLREETLNIQPWQSSDVTYATPEGGPEVSTTTASATSVNISGTVIMGNIGDEIYKIFSGDLTPDFYDLVQTNLSDEGTLVDDYYVDPLDIKKDVGFWSLTQEAWANYRRDPTTCAEPLGSTTSLAYLSTMGSGTNPYFGAWNNDSEVAANPEHPYLFSAPLPEPLPIATALDPYNQLAWYDSNVWAFSIGGYQIAGGKPQLPLDQQQYGRNTIAANIRADLSYDCSMLFNVPSEEDVAIGDQTMKVNLEQAVICEYPNNFMAVSLQISVENAFGFAKFAKDHMGGLETGSSVQILERDSFAESELRWYPGAKAGWVNMTLISTSDVPQAVMFNASTCCMTSPSLACDHFDAEGNFVSSGISAYFEDILSIPRHESAFASLFMYTQQYGEGYCNVTFSQVYFDGKAIAEDATSQFTGKVSFSAPVGPPVTFVVEFYIYYLSMERNTYFFSSSEPGHPANALGVARPEYQDETDDLRRRAIPYIQQAANAEAPGATIIAAWLPEALPIADFARRLLAVQNPGGLYMRVTWPPEQSNATALRFASDIPSTVTNMPTSVYGEFGPVAAPSKAVTITTTYAPPPPFQAPPPPPPEEPPAQSSVPPLPPSPSNQTTTTNRTADCGGQSIDCGAHGVLTAACDCVCQVGWTTQPFQRDGTVRYCMMASDEGTQKHTSLLFGGSNKVGPLGVVVIVVVVVCLMSSSWLCFMMHRRTQASTSKIAQRSIVMFEHERPSEMPRAPVSSARWQLQSQSSTSALLASTGFVRDKMDKECSSWLGEANLPQFQQRHKGVRG